MVCIQRDPSIDREYKNSPVQSLVERQIQVKACIYADEILVYESEKDVMDILHGLRWDVRIIGEEYRTNNLLVVTRLLINVTLINAVTNSLVVNFGNGLKINSSFLIKLLYFVVESRRMILIVN